MFSVWLFKVTWSYVPLNSTFRFTRYYIHKVYLISFVLKINMNSFLKFMSERETRCFLWGGTVSVKCYCNELFASKSLANWASVWVARIDLIFISSRYRGTVCTVATLWSALTIFRGWRIIWLCVLESLEEPHNYYFISSRQTIITIRVTGYSKIQVSFSLRSLLTGCMPFLLFIFRLG